MYVCVSLSIIRRLYFRSNNCLSDKQTGRQKGRERKSINSREVLVRQSIFHMTGCLPACLPVCLINTLFWADNVPSY